MVVELVLDTDGGLVGFGVMFPRVVRLCLVSSGNSNIVMTSHTWTGFNLWPLLTRFYAQKILWKITTI